MPKKFRIFLDSSALISGLNSPTGAAGLIISAFLAGEFFIYLSNQVLEEVQRNIQTKFPLLLLAAAMKLKPNFLITWDIKHFLKREVILNVPFIICTPKEFIQKYWTPPTHRPTRKNHRHPPVGQENKD